MPRRSARNARRRTDAPPSLPGRHPGASRDPVPHASGRRASRVRDGRRTLGLRSSHSSASRTVGAPRPPPVVPGNAGIHPSDVFTRPRGRPLSLVTGLGTESRTAGVGAGTPPQDRRGQDVRDEGYRDVLAPVLRGCTRPGARGAPSKRYSKSFAKIGSSAFVRVIVKVCCAERSTPPFAVPPLSRTRTANVLVPSAPVAGV